MAAKIYKKIPLYVFLISTFLILLISNIVYSQDFPVLKGPYFGQKAPAEKAEVFLDNIISKFNEPEMNAAFTRDGKEFYYCAYDNNNWAIFFTKEINGRWTKPEPLSFTSDYTDRDFTMSPDGNGIYFGSNRPQEKGGKILESLDIYVTERLKTGLWSEPKNIGFPVNTDHNENYPSVARNGNLYFFSNRGNGLGRCDIYVSRLVNGHYLPPENPGRAINSDKNDWDSFIAPDESYIIFSSQNRENTMGGQDLYISYRKSDGSWSKAKNMGERINSESGEICPSVSLDGKYFFFTSRRRGKADIFWIDAKIIDELKNRVN
ncbi:TolB family protein [candidate division KSB1 bacterium]